LTGEPLGQLAADLHSWAEEVLRRARDRVPQDVPVATILTEQPPAGAGPIDNARTSADYVRSLLAKSQ